MTTTVGEEKEAGLRQGQAELWCSLKGDRSQGHRVLKLGWPFTVILSCSTEAFIPSSTSVECSWLWARHLSSAKAIPLECWHLGDLCWQSFQHLAEYILIPEWKSGWHTTICTKVPHTLDWLRIFNVFLSLGRPNGKRTLGMGVLIKEYEKQISPENSLVWRELGRETLLSRGY